MAPDGAEGLVLSAGADPQAPSSRQAKSADATRRSGRMRSGDRMGWL
jgi:hypothetical protein